MRYPAPEKAEIIRLVESSHLSVRRTLEKLGIPRATFYRWYDLYRDGGLGHRLISSQPNACGCQFDEGEEVGRVLFVARGDGSEVLELVEEALDVVPVSVQEGAESGNIHAVWHGPDVGPGTSGVHGLAQRIAVVGPVGHEDLALAEGREHVGGAPAIMGLTLRELEDDRKAIGIHESVDLGGQSAARAPHALGSSVVPSGGRRGVRAPFLTLPPCW